MNNKIIKRESGRKPNQARDISILPGYIKNADASCLINIGNTSVICTASYEKSVPNWLKGSKKGWLTAEYGMIPASTHTRNNREASKGKQAGRTLEIQRLIGRSLRSSIDLKRLDEIQIKIDCDVINADGGTRTASITGGWVVLYLLINSLLKNKVIKKNPLHTQVAAISCGIYKGTEILDLDYFEDSNAEIDANFIISKPNNLIEVQATAENGNFSKKQLYLLTDMACEECNRLFDIQLEAVKNEK